jgi:hypothetical protein
MLIICTQISTKTMPIKICENIQIRGSQSHALLICRLFM